MVGFSWAYSTECFCIFGSNELMIPSRSQGVSLNLSLFAPVYESEYNFFMEVLIEKFKTFVNGNLFAFKKAYTSDLGFLNDVELSNHEHTYLND